MLMRLHDALATFALAAQSGTGGVRYAVDKRTLTKSYKLMNQVVTLCQQPRMQLKNSPPYILDILPDTYQHLQLIVQRYEAQPGGLQALADCQYLLVFLNNLIAKSKATIKLMKDARSKIFDESSSARRQLTKYSLVFSHMLSELRGIFPNGVYVGSAHAFRLTKPDAAEWWYRTFGERTIIKWMEFREKLGVAHEISSELEATALKTTIDLTCNNHVSIFEFDVFVRLFHPWNTILRNWNLAAVSHPGKL